MAVIGACSSQLRFAAPGCAINKRALNEQGLRVQRAQVEFPMRAIECCLTSCSVTTKEMLHSEGPCAIALMFTFSRPRAASVRPTVPESRSSCPPGS